MKRTFLRWLLGRIFSVLFCLQLWNNWSRRWNWMEHDGHGDMERIKNRLADTLQTATPARLLARSSAAPWRDESCWTRARLDHVLLEMPRKWWRYVKIQGTKMHKASVRQAARCSVTSSHRNPATIQRSQSCSMSSDTRRSGWFSVWCKCQKWDWSIFIRNTKILPSSLTAWQPPQQSRSLISDNEVYQTHLSLELS